ncbi:G2/M phase-specific E3 ubiquitin-protein ligase [Acipenser ruthenus]|uniref:G2/M phase-specific E3 ubiquitin-protein ligase n=1 Tax=Acipenser ruthenus TaxID=7906 RepID=A0A444UZC0_ACIRT|nr:G2/M phase-specific E3 ubiquitin-protein ligase [Acipenser ruthenus]
MLREEVYENSTLLHLARCIRVIQSVEDKHQLIQDDLHWYLLDRTMHSQKRFKEGLKTLGVLDAMTVHPELFKNAFIWKKVAMTSEVMASLFQITYSPLGSNGRIRKERLIGYWRDFLQDCEEEECSTQLPDVLSFVTGENQIPPLCFDPQPSIEFIQSKDGNDELSKYPEANTCASVLRLPFSKSYEQFKTNMDFGIQNSPGFGRA